MTIRDTLPSGLTCPLCAGSLETWARDLLQVEFCDRCSALFLDRGELFNLFRSEGYNCPPEAILRGGFVETSGPSLNCPKCLKPTLVPGAVQGADMWHCTPCNGFLVERELLLGEASAHEVPLDLKGFKRLGSSASRADSGSTPGGVLGRLVSWARGLTGIAVLLAACGPDGDPPVASAQEGGAGDPDAVPTFRVDPTWPEEMPDLWIMGAVTAVFVDGQDHVWVTHLPETLTPEETSAVQDPPIGTCCVPAPVVVEFDPEGRVVQGWGRETQDLSELPRNPHGLFVDHDDNVWVGTYRHHRVMKFTRDGRHLLTIGEYDETGGSDHTSLLGGPAGIWVDPSTNEVFVADGYVNRRVAVFDAETGAYRRHWGAYGEAPDDAYEFDYDARDPDGEPPRQFSTVHGLIGSNDGLIYVADRRGNRIQVFRQDGEFVTEKVVAARTRASGSAFVIALSPDDAQSWLYLADGTNHKIWTLRRSDLEIVGEFGRGGRQVGQFLRPHGMGIDSRGNLYVGEASTGRRVQRFTVHGGG